MILDCLDERRSPLSPESAVKEFVALLKIYGVRSVTDDRYSEELIRELFRSHGIEYRMSEQTKSELYVDLPLLTTHHAAPLDDPRVVSQLLSLERRTNTASSKDTVEHPHGALYDVANAVAGALVLASRGGDEMFSDYAERDGFGLEKAIDYLIGEKFLNFLEASDQHPEFAAKLPRFGEEIKQFLEPGEIRAYLDGVRRVGALGHTARDDAYAFMQAARAIPGGPVEWAEQILLLERARALLLP